MKTTNLLSLGGMLFASMTLLTTMVTAADTHRYIVERTFPAHALDGVDAKGISQVNANNASVDVRWVESFANADKSKTYCVYEGPNEAAIRKAAELNHMTVDHLTEVPTNTSTVPAAPNPNTHRFVVRKSFASADAARADSQRAVGGKAVSRLTTFLSLDEKSAYAIYEGPDEARVRAAADGAGGTVDFVAEVPALLLPN